jgi:DDE superfamily endonuclease
VDDEPCHQGAGLDTKKKSLAASERTEEERARWREQVKEHDARGLVFVDECGSNIALTPLYARAPKGQRARGSVPRNRGKNTTLIASLSWEGVGASMIIEGAANAAAFEAYIEHILVPSLQTGQRVVMDNLRAHKGTRVRQLIEDQGCQVLFLPAYSPDFSPILRDLLQGQSLPAARRGQDARGPGRSHWTGSAHGHLSGCAWLVRTLWLRASSGENDVMRSSIFPLTAVYSWLQTCDSENAS